MEARKPYPQIKPQVPAITATAIATSSIARLIESMELSSINTTTGNRFRFVQIYVERPDPERGTDGYQRRCAIA
jgi:hypothetical protein